MIQLINRTDFANNNRQITQSNYNSGTLAQHIEDAQKVDLQSLMGRDFFNDMIRNYTDANYQTLLNGGDYIYSGSTYSNYGLKSVLVLYAYGRYIISGSQTDTPFGYVEKDSNDSTKVELSRKKAMGKSNSQAGFNDWENVKDFLDRNASDYPLWNASCIQKTGVFRFKKIS